MTSYQLSARPHWDPRAGRFLATAAVGLALLGITALAVVMVPAPSTIAIVGTAGFLGVGAWLVLSERYELSLAVVMLYLGLLDGFLKLKTGTQVVTFGRDVLLFAVVIGILARGALRGQTLKLPPLSAWVMAWVVLILLEMFHPEGGALGHRLAGLRQELEFVPLFFLGYHIMRTPGRLRGFLVLLAIIGAANGVVSLVQFSMSPSQVASWGPGYADRINGEGVAARTFQDASGQDRVRPFGLGSDSGQGGIFGMLALPAALTLLAITRGKRYRLLAAPAAIGVALAVITSQGRGAVLATAATLLGFAALSIVSSKRVGPTLVGIGLAVIVAVGVTSALTGGSSGGSGSQFRYSSISPGKVFGTAEQDRGHSYKVVPKYMAKYPLGAGLGSVGPATAIYAARRNLNGETQFSYLLVEGGIAGMIIILALHLQLLRLAFTRIRKLLDRELRAFLAAIAAPLIGIFALYFGGSPLSGSPSAPYFYFAAGTLAFWLTGEQWKLTPIARAQSAESRA
jgi:hypothetical protein